MLSLGSGRQLEAGNLGHGGSSSSTLSPLAQPFTVERPRQKPKTNPIHVLDPGFNAAYDYPSKPHLENWLHLHPPTTVSDGYSHQSLDFDPSFGANSCYGAASSIVNTRSPLSPTHPFAYSQNSETGSNVLIESDIYYGQYPSGILDSNTSVIDPLAPSEKSPQPEFFPNVSGYGISTSVAIPLDVSSPTDYSQNLSDFGYGTKWTGLWHGQFDAEKEQRKAIGGIDGEFPWKGNSFSSDYRSLSHQGIQKHQPGSASASEDLIATEENSSIWQGKFNESLIRQVHVGLNGHGLKNSYVSSEEKVGPSFGISGTSVSSPSPAPQEMSNPQLLDLSSMQAWNPLNPNSVPFDRSFTQLVSSTTIPTVFHPSTGFPATKVYKPLAGCVDACRGSDGKEGYAHISRILDDGNVFLNSSLMKDSLPLTNVLIVDYSSGHSSQGKTESTKSCTNLLNTCASGSEGPVDPLKSSSETVDPFIPAVDSPCWKGAPASRYSPFTISEVVDSLTLAKQLEGCNNLEKCQPNLPVNDDDDAATISASKMFGSLICPGSSPQSEHKFAKKGSKFSKDMDGNCYSDGIQESRSGHLPFEYPKNCSELKASGRASNVYEARVTSDGVDFKGSTQDGPVSNSTCEPLNALPDSPSESSPVKTDSQMLVKTMHNLSEVLLSGFNSDANTLKEDDFNVLQLVMDNLGKCILKKVGVSRSTPRSVSQLDSLFHHQRPSDSHKATTIERSWLTGSVIGDVLSQNRQPVNTEGTMLTNRSPMKVDEFYDFTSMIGDMDFEENDGTSQELEKFLTRDFSEHEEKHPHPEAILYRDLWIKAEASLCSMKFQLRLARMKIEMEKHRQQVVKGNSDSLTMDSHGSPKKPAEKPVNLEEVRSSNLHDVGGQEQDDVESSVMARFRVLKHRIDTFNSMSEELQQPCSDSGVQEKIPDQFFSGRKSKARTGQPMKIVDVGFTDTKPWPFVRDRDIGFGICSEDLEEQEKTREFGVCIDPPLIMTSKFLSPVVPPALENPDSDSVYDWEHVPKEELAW